MTETLSIQSLAAEANGWFHRTKRGDETIWVTKDGHPEWVKDMCFAAHDAGGMFPDDLRYEFIVEALNALEEHDDTDEARDSIEADVYTSDLTAWLNSRVDRTGYVDDAVFEFGVDEGKGIVERLQIGQLMEKWEVFDAVLSFLEDRLSDLEDEGDEEDDA